jgi:hypothetical protein
MFMIHRRTADTPLLYLGGGIDNSSQLRVCSESTIVKLDTILSDTVSNKSRALLPSPREATRLQKLAIVHSRAPLPMTPTALPLEDRRNMELLEADMVDD